MLYAGSLEYLNLNLKWTGPLISGTNIIEVLTHKLKGQTD